MNVVKRYYPALVDARIRRLLPSFVSYLLPEDKHAVHCCTRVKLAQSLDTRVDS